MRCVGVFDAADSVIDRFVARAAARGLSTERAPHVAIAHAGAGVAHADDGSFLVLDGEAYPVRAPDEMAAFVLDAVREGASEIAFEGMATWWDAQRREVAVFGDPVGAVPVVSARVGSAVVWSSEHNDLLAAGLRAEPDPDAIALLAAIGWLPAPMAYLRGSSAIPAGRRLRLAVGREPVLETWFTHSAVPPTSGDADAQADVLGEALVHAVQQRAIGGRIGAFLSAGIDSTAIVAVLRCILDLPVETFTFRYLGYDGEHNENELAAETARLLGTRHTTISIAPEDLRDRFPDIVRAFGSPVSFGVHSFKQDLVRDAGVDVMLTGADPGGWYAYDRSGVLASLLWRLPPRARLGVQRAAGRLRRVPKVGAVYWSALLANNGIKSEYLPLDVRRSLVGGAADSAARRYAEALGRFAHDVGGEAPEHRATFVCQVVRLYDAEWNTRWGRAFGYPIRAPFYDARLALAVDRRRPWDQDKAPLRRFTARLVSPERAYAPKIYQEAPLAEWLRGPLRDFMRDALSRDRVEASGTMAYEPVRRIVEEHEGGIDRKWPLWQLMTAVEWALTLAPDDEPLLAP